MAEIITPTTNAETITNAPQGLSMDGVLGLFKNPIVLFLIFIVLIIIVVIIYFVMKNKKEDALRERDDINYGIYKRVLRDCVHNQEPKWIHKTYSLKNILLFGIPIFWNEHSLKVTDVNDVLLGYYRGHSLTHRGETIYCLYKTKRLFIFENLFLLKTIDSFTYEHKEKIVVKGKEEWKYETKLDHFDEFYEWLPKNVNRSLRTTLKVQCNGIAEDGYFRIPNYLRQTGDKGLVAMDLRWEHRQNTKEYATNEQYTRTITDLHRNIDEAARSNPYISQGRHQIEKTEEEKRIDDQTPNQNKGL